MHFSRGDYVTLGVERDRWLIDDSVPSIYEFTTLAGLKQFRMNDSEVQILDIVCQIEGIVVEAELCRFHLPATSQNIYGKCIKMVLLVNNSLRYLCFTAENRNFQYAIMHRACLS